MLHTDFSGRVVGLAVAFMLLLCSQAFADQKGNEIAERVYNRYNGNDRTEQITLVLTNKRGATRERVIDMRARDYGKDTKTISVFLRPADVKDTMYLAWTYDDPTRGDDRWLYMPSLKNVRRVNGSSKNDYFMGTDFTYDELSRRSPSKDTHEFMGEEKYEGYSCWKLKSVPVDEKEGYTHKIRWVDQKSDVVVKEEFYDKDGLFKVYTVKEMKLIDNVWTTMHTQMDNVSRSHKTDMYINSIRYNTGINDGIFNVSSLQKGKI